ncbi:MAG: DUF7577 domain-containing protein, partial [Actinomycetota bacterium]
MPSNAIATIFRICSILGRAPDTIGPAASGACRTARDGGIPPLPRSTAPPYASSVLTCPACGTDNPEQARFCMACASPLAIESSA